MKTKSIVNALLKIIPAVILLQTLFFKFSAAPESVYIFEQLNMEPWGRIGLGLIELIVAVLILIPKTTCLGALLGIGIMLGALFSHLTKLGVVVQDDGGTLFILALVTLLFCLVLAWQRRYNIPFIKNLF